MWLIRCLWYIVPTFYPFNFQIPEDHQLSSNFIAVDRAPYGLLLLTAFEYPVILYSSVRPSYNGGEPTAFIVFSLDGVVTPQQMDTICMSIYTELARRSPQYTSALSTAIINRERGVAWEAFSGAGSSITFLESHFYHMIKIQFDYHYS